MDKETKPRYRIEFITTVELLSRYAGRYDAYFERFKQKHHVEYRGETKRYKFISKI